MAAPKATPDERGLGPAAKEVVEHASALARLEARLALLEVKEKLQSLGLGVGLAIAAAVIALYAFGFGLATVVAALETALPAWASLLIVTALLVLTASVLGLVGVHTIRSSVPPVPEQAIEEARKTSEVVRANGGRRGQ
jgi:hypothetical protein